MERMTATSKLGRIYLGDPCYIMEDYFYNNVWGKKFNFQDGEFTFDSEKNTMAVFGTGGDGCFSGIPVDSGAIALVPEEFWDHSNLDDTMIILDTNKATIEMDGDIEGYGLSILVKVNGKIVKCIDIPGMRDPEDEEDEEEIYDEEDEEE